MTALKTLRLAKLQAQKEYNFHKAESIFDDDMYFRKIQKRRMREDLLYIEDLTKAINILKTK